MAQGTDKESAGKTGPGRIFGAWLFALGSLAALAPRLLYLFQVRDATFFKAPLNDSAYYVSRAWEILHGDIVGKAVSVHGAPIYPYFIAAVMGLAGSEQGLWWLRLVQALLSAATAGLLSLTALRLFGRWAGVATALLAAFYAPFLFSSGEIQGTSLTLLLLAWAFWLLAAGEAPSRRRLFCVGVLMGLASLGQAGLLVLAPAAWLGLVLFRPSSWSSGRAWGRGLFLATGLLLAVLPFTLRNRLAGDDWVLISGDAGAKFYIGNNPEATGGFHLPVALAADPDGSGRSRAEKAKGRPLKPSEVSRYWADRAFAFVVEHPGRAAGLLLRKLALLLNRYEIPNRNNFYFFREYYAPILKWPLATYSMLLPLGILGLAFGARRDRRSRMQAIALLAAALTLPIFFVTGPGRLPMALLFFPFAGFGIALLGRTLAARRWSLFGLAIVIVLAASALARLPLVEQGNYRREFLALGNFWFSQEDYQRAAFYCAEALRQDPDSAPAWQNLGYAYLQQGDFQRAEDCLWKAVDLDPGFGYAWGNLAKLYFDYTRPILAKRCLDKAEAIAPELEPRLAEIRKMLPVISSNWDERAQHELSELSKKEREDPGNPRHFAERAQILGLRLERHAEALAALDSIPQAAMDADSSLAQYVKFMRARITTVYEHERYLQ